MQADLIRNIMKGFPQFNSSIQLSPHIFTFLVWTLCSTRVANFNYTTQFYQLSSPYYTLDPELIHIITKFIPFHHPLHISTSLASGKYHLLFVSTSMIFLNSTSKCHLMQNLFFSIWLISLNIMLSGLSMLSQVERFHYSLKLNNISLCIWVIVSVCVYYIHFDGDYFQSLYRIC